jgi:hypothetical protein
LDIGEKPTGELSFSHSCGCTAKRTPPPQEPDQADLSVFVCSLCGHDFFEQIVRDSPDTKLSWITRVAIFFLGLVFLLPGLAVPFDLSTGAAGLIGKVVFLVLSALIFFWALSGTLSSRYMARLSRLAPITRRISCLATILGPALMILWLAWLLLRRLF